MQTVKLNLYILQMAGILHRVCWAFVLCLHTVKKNVNKTFIPKIFCIEFIGRGFKPNKRSAKDLCNKRRVKYHYRLKSFVKLLSKIYFSTTTIVHIVLFTSAMRRIHTLTLLRCATSHTNHRTKPLPLPYTVSVRVAQNVGTLNIEYSIKWYMNYTPPQPFSDSPLLKPFHVDPNARVVSSE